MTTISDLSEDLVWEILARVPLTSLSAVRTTCKTWNDLSKSLILGQKAARKDQYLEFMVIDSKVCSVRVDLRNEDGLVDPSIKLKKIPNHDQVKISQVHHCNGLLLCVSRDKNYTRLFVWNPYLGQTRLIPHRNKFLDLLETYGFGYDNKNRNHKIVRLLCDWGNLKYEVYDFSFDSWQRVLDVDDNHEWDFPFDYSRVSLKGNTYFYFEGEVECYLRCFDYTRERFGPRLLMPFHPESPRFNTAILSWVRDEKLAVLDRQNEIMEFWITTKIEPNEVLWSKFLKLDVRVINGLPDGFSGFFKVLSFFVDEEKEVAVLFHNVIMTQEVLACVIGKDGYSKSVNNREVLYDYWNSSKCLCSSYVPSLVQLQINKQGETKERNDDQSSVPFLFYFIFLFLFFLLFILFTFW